ncbi:MAG TPA: zf-HC2 domain-containing protein [Blastocatellia bacterium]|nr:zf-HC2 domain-containing protein [Blastocatellia bacterium]
MSEHLKDQDIARYRSRMMSPVELLSANEHLSSCDLCYARFGADEHLEAAYNLAREGIDGVEPPEDYHLSYECVAAYVDGELGERESNAVESHIQSCRQCEVDVNDLRSLKDSFGPARSAAPDSKRLFLLRRPRFALMFQVAAAAAMILLLVWLGLLWQQKRVAELESKIAEAEGKIQTQSSTIEQIESQMGELQKENDELRQELSAYEGARPDRQPGGLAPGEAISLKDADSVVGLNERGELTGLAPLSPAYERLVKTALEAGEARVPDSVADLIGRRQVLMGSNDAYGSFALLAPLGTVIDSDQPALKWSALDGATSYVVGVYDSRLNEVASSPPLQSTEWTVPRPLKRGAVYNWQVRAVKDGEEIKLPRADAPAAKFKVLEAAKSAELERARRAHGGSRLVLGVLYAQAGLLDDAEREFELLAQANPQSRIARRLLDRLRAKRRY